MDGGFSFPLAKESLKPSRSDSEKKRKKPLLDTSHIDRVTEVQSAPSGSIEPSPVNPLTKKANVGEEEGL